MLIIMLTSTVALLLAGAAFVACEVFAFRKTAGIVGLVLLASLLVALLLSSLLERLISKPILRLALAARFVADKKELRRAGHQKQQRRNRPAHRWVQRHAGADPITRHGPAAGP